MKAVVITIIMTYYVLDVLYSSAEVTPTQKEKGIKYKNNIFVNSKCSISVLVFCSDALLMINQ